MITEKEFLDQMLEKGLNEFKSKRQLAFAIGLDNAQALNHWIKREKVPGDWKPKVSALLGISWLDDTESLLAPSVYGQMNFDACDFAVLGIIEYTNKFPDAMTAEFRIKAFKSLYKAFFIQEARELGAIPLLTLIN